MPDRLATELLLIARHPGTGRLTRPGTLGYGLRAALFVDLALAGRIRSEHGAPAIADPAPLDDPKLEAVAAVVAQRPEVVWFRWYRQVNGDVSALVRELVEAQRWSPGPRAGWPRRPVYDDVDPIPGRVLGERADAILTGRRGVPDARSGILALLCGMCGTLGNRPKPRGVRKEFRPLLDQVRAFGDDGLETVVPILSGASFLLSRSWRR